MTSDRVAFRAPSDPLLRDADLVHVVELPVLGIPTRFESNSETVAALVVEDFGSWRRASTLVDPTIPHCTVRIVVHAEPDADPREPLTRSTADGRLFLHSGASVAVVDPARRESLAYVSADLVASEDLFRESFLAAVTFALVAAFDRHPVHAAAIARDGRALLLAGPSGAGKSTLACLAHLEGFRLMSDDIVWVQSAPALRIWASTRGAHLRADALEKLAITDMHPAMRARDGKRRVPVMSADETTPWVAAGDARVCILEPGSAAHLERLTPAAIAEALAGQVDPGFDRFPERQARVIEALAAPGGWRLTLSSDPREALPFIEAMLGVTAP
ncbi:MAG: hypothetical protein ABIY52_00870 [Gemmatimonadaceae bacterium]